MCLNLLKDTCGEAMMRLTIFILNGVFLLIALLFVGFGFFLEVEYARFEHATEDKFGATPAGIIIIGAFMLFMAILGIWGIIRKSKFLTGFYAVALIVILLAQIVAIVAPIVATEDAEKVLEKAGYKTMSEWDGEKGQISKSWNSIQKNLNCCGVQTFADWKNSTSFQAEAKKLKANATIPVPDSCCNEWTKNCGLNWTQESELKSTGCMVEIESWVKGHVAVICGSLGALCFVELIAMIISFHLIKTGFTYERLA